LELVAFRRAAGVIVLFPGMKAYTARHGIPEDHVCYVPNGCEPATYPASMPFPPADPFTLTYFGSFGPVNGLQTILEAAAIVRDMPAGRNIRFRLIGDGTARNALQKQAAALKLENVVFHDPVSKDELIRVAEESHAFIYCHTYMPVVARYGLSANKLFEYMMFGRPVIFSCTSYNDPIREFRAGLSVAASDATGMASAILQLSGLGADEWRQMGNRGREYVVQNHSLPKLAKRLEAFLSKMTEETDGQSREPAFTPNSNSDRISV
jgi:glycosyltransferase involved in cell wall biosynthesis